MSVPPPLPPRPPRALGGCAAAVLVLLGIILLLPGLCSLILATIALTGGGGLRDVWGLLPVTLIVGAAGVAVIVYAVRNG